MKKVSTTLLSPRELSTLTQRVQAITEKLVVNDAFYVILKPKLDQSNNILLNSIDKSQFNKLTQELSDRDVKRDKAFVAFRDYCKASSNFNDSSIQNAGKKLVELIERFGWTLYMDGYAAQSARLESLFNEIDTKGYEVDLKAINAIQWYQNLKNEQQSFESTYRAKNDLNIEKAQYRIRVSREEVVSYLRPLLTYVEVMSKIQKGKYLQAEEQMNAVISDIMSVARSRQTRNENQDEENPVSPENPIPETEPIDNIVDLIP